ncbi:MAG: O-antigen ligase family protein [Paludibacteraceae bacterium]|nr:O-antigen ligase family protein [Paludibacteraceae bacterium]
MIKSSSILHIYTLLWSIYFLQGTVFSHYGGGMAQMILVTLLLFSIYCFFYVNINYNINFYLKALNYLILMFSVYGVIRIFRGESIILEHNLNEVIPFYYLKNIYISLLPIYVYYLLAKIGVLNKRYLQIYLLLFLFLVSLSYIENYMNASKSAESEEITNNMGIRFMTLIPMLFFLEKRRLLQYAALVYILTFVVMGMKRGAILLAVVLTIYFLYNSLKEASQKEKLYLLLLSIVAIVLICMVVTDLMDNSAYFNRRVQQTLEGNSSGRDYIYATLWYAFLENGSLFHCLLGFGAHSTISIAGNSAHNDWLELLINNGLLGIVLYVVYWWRFASLKNIIEEENTRCTTVAYCITFFMLTLYSMSYNNMDIFSTMGLGYCVAKADV